MSINPVSWMTAALMVALIGCGDAADGGVLDGAVDGAADGGAFVTPPDIPWLAEGVPPIMLAPCPDGWREVAGGEVTECDAYPEGGPATCGAGEAHFPGEAACRAIGEPCAAGDYATTLPAEGTVLYAKAGAAPGGDGTIGAPYAGLSEVPWASLAAGTTVALAKGTYEGTLPLRAGVQVVGACVRETVLTGLAAPVTAVVTVTSAGATAELRNLAIADAPQTAVRVERGRGVALRGVLIDEVTEFGVLALDRGTQVVLENVVVRATRSRDGLFGRGVDVEGGAHLTATHLIVAGNREMGVFAGQGGTEVVFADAIIRDTEPRTRDGFRGWGLAVEAGARFEASRFVVVGNHEISVFGAGESTEFALTDVVVAGTRPSAADGQFGRGVSIESGAHFDAERLLVADHHDVAIYITDEGSVMTLRDVVVRDTAPQASDGLSGRGFSVEVDGRLDAARMLVLRSHEMGIFVGADRGQVSLTDVAIRDTRPQESDGLFGRALDVQDGATLDALRLFAADNYDVGIYAVSEGTLVSLTDVVVRDTRSSGGPNSVGRGISAEEAARVDGERVRIDGAVEAGVLAILHADVDLRDVEVANVMRGSCDPGPCPDGPHGYAAVALASRLSLSRFQLHQAEVCGILVGMLRGSEDAPAVDLANGVVSGSAIGACVQVDGYDLGRLTRGVQYRDNGSNLDSTMLPVPALAEAVAP